MFTLSESAHKELEAYFADKEKTPIRIYLAPGGWSGPRLALALDEPNDTDTVYEENGFKFCVNTELIEKTGAISIDLSYMGFVVESANPLGGGGSACGGCSSAGSCG